jgi:hypothetical protein
MKSNQELEFLHLMETKLQKELDCLFDNSNSPDDEKIDKCNEESEQISQRLEQLEIHLGKASYRNSTWSWFFERS